MLVLTRKPQQTIRIGDEIVVKILRTGPGDIRIGIDAPEHIHILRGELEVHAQGDRPPAEKPAGIRRPRNRSAPGAMPASPA
ncbi:MAG: carbon storage regulator [Planctomycetota bacterium]|nr:MAG: carbon storage regulator [Planctomycetota bacterium]